MSKKVSKPLLNSLYDLSGNSIVRVFRQQITAKFIPMGNYRGGAGLKCLLIFFVLHYVGRPLFFVLIRFERQLSLLYKVRERMKNGEQS